MSNYSNQSNQGNNSVYWLIAIGLIITGIAAPVGIIMIVLRLFGGQPKRGHHPYYSQQDPWQNQRSDSDFGARTTGNFTQAPEFQSNSRRQPSKVQRAKSAQSPIHRLSQQGKALFHWGGLFSVIFLFTIIASLGDAIYDLLEGDFRDFLEEAFDTLPLMCLLGGSLGCMWAGLRKRKQARRYRSYLAMISSHKSITISSLASATGFSPQRVRDDLEDMLETGVFPVGFLDYSGDRLILSEDGLTDPPPKKEPEAEQPPQDPENAILSEIRAVNDAIANEKLSQQIDYIGIITSKILDYQKSHPDKSPQLHSFLSYYLPTTLKILHAYAQLEAQEISGENISSAMERIERMMDKVVEGFEKQLDLLFQGDAMDITTDVEVLERMLAKDGLSEQPGLTLNL